MCGTIQCIAGQANGPKRLELPIFFLRKNEHSLLHNEIKIPHLATNPENKFARSGVAPSTPSIANALEQEKANMRVHPRLQAKYAHRCNLERASRERTEAKASMNLMASSPQHPPACNTVTAQILHRPNALAPAIRCVQRETKSFQDHRTEHIWLHLELRLGWCETQQRRWA